MELQHLSDAELVMLCRQGRQAAWSTLVRRFQRLIYTIPRRAQLPEQSAADVFQATFARLFEHIDRLEQPGRVRAWLVTTARRETLRQLRIGRPIESFANSEPDAVVEGAADESSVYEVDAAGLAGTSDEPSEEERWHEVRLAIDRLDARCRQLIELLFLSEQELPYTEIGERLQMPPGSIGPTRARCLGKLRVLLKS